MASRQVLQEFLASLGFKIDLASFKKFTAAIGTAERFAVNLSKKLAILAFAAEGTGVILARSLERMFYMSRRTGASVGNITAMAFGFEQVGLSAEDARSAIESMAREIRTNPGLMGLMKSLGVNTSEKDPTKLFHGLIHQLSRMPYFMGSQIAEMFGIPEHVFRMLTLPGAMRSMEEAENKQREIYRRLGIDQDRAAATAKEYMNTLRNIWTQLGAIFDKVLIAAAPKFQEIARVVEEVLTDLANTDFSSLDFSHLSGFVDEQLEKWGAWGHQIKVVKNLLPDLFRLATTNIGRTINSFFGPGENHTFLTPPGGKGVPLGMRLNNPGNLRKWGNAIVENGFAKFATPEEGLSAMAGQLLRYSGRGIRSIKDIISTYSPATGEGNSGQSTANYISGVVRELGIAPGQNLNLQDPNQLAALMAAMIKVEQGYQPFTQEQLLASAQSRIVNIHQQNELTIHGDKAAELGREIAHWLTNHLQADIVRNAQGATR